ncbi:MAG: guanylate kinase [Desulfovibrionaceae bacterium]
MSGSQTAGSTRKGLVLVICAPSGTGKSTLVRRLVDEFPGIGFSVSCTTRAPRGQERDGVEYHFLTREEFLEKRDEGGFAEWAEVHGNFYGTPLAPVREAQSQGRDMLFDIDVQGASQLRKSIPDGVHVFLLPPSRQELERRLIGRGTDDPEVVERRMAAAGAELREAAHFDHWIINDDLDRASDELRAVYLAARTCPARRPGLLDAVLETFR